MIGTWLRATARAGRRLPPRRRVWVAGGALLVVALLAIGVAFVPANHGSRAATGAASQSGGMRLVSLVCSNGGGCYSLINNYDNCVDGDDAGHVQSNPCWTDDNYQVWYELDNGNMATIHNNQTGKCLDSNYNGDLYTSPCWDNDLYQQWIKLLTGFSGLSFQNVQTGLCLEADSDYHAHTASCATDGQDSQTWKWPSMWGWS